MASRALLLYIYWHNSAEEYEQQHNDSEQQQHGHQPHVAFSRSTCVWSSGNNRSSMSCCPVYGCKRKWPVPTKFCFYTTECGHYKPYTTTVHHTPMHMEVHILGAIGLDV
eukprot:12434-Heterococcus_DN1.PRE.7